MFRLDRSLPGVPAVESEVVAVFRSVSPVNIPLEKMTSPACEAFVCVVKMEENVQVLPALYLRDTKNILIYTAGRGYPENEKIKLEKVLQEALRFVESLGFAMEAVNLKFGTALREVLVRNIPVILDPLSRRTTPLGQAEKEKGNEASAEKGTGTGRNEQAGPKGEKTGREEMAVMLADAVNRAIEKIRSDLIEQAETEGGPNSTEVKPPRNMFGNPAEEKPRKTLNFSKKQVAVAKGPGERGAAGLAESTRQFEERLAAERAERQRLATEKALAEGRLGEMEKALRLAEEKAAAMQLQQEQLAAEKANRERLLAEKTAAEERAAKLAESVRRTENVLTAEKAERERLEAEKARAAERLGKLEKSLHLAEEKASAATAESGRLTGEKADREGLLREKAAAEKRAAELSESLRLIEERLSAERAERGRLATEKTRAEVRLKAMEAASRLERKQGPAAAAVGQADLERLAREKEAAEKRASDLAEAARRAEVRADAERIERERLAAEKAQAEMSLKKLAEASKSAPAKTSPEKREKDRGLPKLNWFSNPGKVRSEASDIQPPRPAARPSFPDAYFQVVWELSCVEYGSTEEILEVWGSMSVSQLALEGYPSQYCSAHILALKKGDGLHVYVAFRLYASERILVYAPPTQPRSQAAYKKTIAEAINFLSVAGYLVEPIPLGPNGENRSKVLESIPVLSGPPRGNPGTGISESEEGRLPAPL